MEHNQYALSHGIHQPAQVPDVPKLKQKNKQTADRRCVRGSWGCAEIRGIETNQTTAPAPRIFRCNPNLFKLGQGLNHTFEITATSIPPMTSCLITTASPRHLVFAHVIDCACESAFQFV